MPVVQSRYRVVDFIGGRILESRELNTLQTIIQGTDLNNNVYSYEDTAVYRQGALLNATVNFTPSTGVISLSATNSALPILVFVRDRWEAFLSGELTSVTLPGWSSLSGTQVPGFPIYLYLNWQLALVTSADDSTLVDGATGDPTANMGQLILQMSATDTSGTSLGSGQLAKNTSPIILVTTGNGVRGVVPTDNVNVQAYGTLGISGLVSLTTSTSSGEACSSDDPRLSNTRTPSAASVEDAMVRTPVSPGGTNADGTTIYSIGSDPGGISATKIVLQASTQLLSDAWTWLVTAFNSLLTRYNAHEGIVLGLSNTHPFPTPAQVGAVPASHIGLPLNLTTSHSATVNQSSGGFVVNRTPGTGGGFTSTPLDPAYGIFESGTNKCSLNHNGDIYSYQADQLVASPGGSPVTYTGSMGLLSNLATVVRDHVNQTVDCNPHGLALSDLITGTPVLGSILIWNGTGFQVRTYTVNNVSSSRAVAVTYQNTSAAHMTMSGSLATTGSATGACAVHIWPPSGSLGSSLVYEENSSTATVSGGSAAFFATIPQGWYYQLQASGAVTGTIQFWVEGVFA